MHCQLLLRIPGHVATPVTNLISISRIVHRQPDVWAFKPTVASNTKHPRIFLLFVVFYFFFRVICFFDLGNKPTYFYKYSLVSITIYFTNYTLIKLLVNGAP